MWSPLAAAEKDARMRLLPPKTLCLDTQGHWIPGYGPSCWNKDFDFSLCLMDISGGPPLTRWHPYLWHICLSPNAGDTLTMMLMKWAFSFSYLVHIDPNSSLEIPLKPFLLFIMEDPQNIVTHKITTCLLLSISVHSDIFPACEWLGMFTIIQSRVQWYDRSIGWDSSDVLSS